MGVHLYCIVPPGHQPPPGAAGVDGRRVRSVDVGGVAAWYSEADEPHRPTLERVREHDAVVRTAGSMEVSPVPVRFGQWFQDLDRLGESVREGAPGHAAVLEELAGCMEFGVHLGSPTAPEEGAAPDGEAPPEKNAEGGSASGREHLRGLADRGRLARERAMRAEALAGELEATLGPLVRRARKDDGAEVAHLVRRTDFDAYRAGVERFRRHHPDTDVVVTGPWPPYSFVG